MRYGTHGEASYAIKYRWSQPGENVFGILHSKFFRRKLHIQYEWKPSGAGQNMFDVIGVQIEAADVAPQRRRTQENLCICISYRATLLTTGL